MTRKLGTMAILILVVTTILGGQTVLAQRPNAAANHYFVGFNRPISANDRASLVSQGVGIGKAFAEVNAVEIIVRNPNQLNGLLRNPNVDYVEEVPMRYPLDLGTSQLVPNLDNGLYGLINTKATVVHTRSVTGTNINVGVADTGIDYNHPDIAPNYKGGIDTVGVGDNDPWWNSNLNETHGTHVAGTILAANNSNGVLGVAYHANLFYARVLGPNGGSTADIMEGVRWLVETKNCKVVNLSLGGALRSKTEENFYKQMRSLGALIVAASGNDGSNNLSFPAGYTTNISVGAVDKNNVVASFSNRGRGLDVVAPGVNVLSSVPTNSGTEAYVTAGAVTYGAIGMGFSGQTNGIPAPLFNCGLSSPGGCPGVAGKIALIQRGTLTFAEKVTNATAQGAVAAIIYNNVPGDFAGTLGSAGPWIPVVSVSDTVGTSLLSKVGTSVTVVNKLSSWDTFSGTSMATPHVTGVIALIWSANPGLSNSTVESYLFTTATDLGPARYDTTYGNGLVNADLAVAKTGH